MVDCNKIITLRVGEKDSVEDGCQAPTPDQKLFLDTAKSVTRIDRATGRGSGFASGVDEITTNAHVVAGGDNLTVVTPDKRRLPAYIKKMDDINDLAILKVPGLNLPAITLGRSDGLKAGSRLLSAGHPEGSEEIKSSPGTYISRDAAKTYVLFPKEGIWPDVLKAASSKDPDERRDGLAKMNSEVLAISQRTYPGSSGSLVVEEAQRPDGSVVPRVVGINFASMAEQDLRDYKFAIPVEKLIELKESEGKFDFHYDYRSNFESHPISTGMVNSGLAASAFLLPRTTAVLLGITGTAGFFLDSSRYGNDHYRQELLPFRQGLGLGLAAGSLLQIHPYTRTAGKVVMGASFLGAVALDFIPHEKGLVGITRKDGSDRPPLFWDK